MKEFLRKFFKERAEKKVEFIFGILELKDSLRFCSENSNLHILILIKILFIS